MTIGTDFDQFCAACELLFWGLIKCCSRIYQIKNAVLEFRKIKFCSGMIFFYEHKILSKMLLPDDIRDLAGRAINFSKKAGI